MSGTISCCRFHLSTSCEPACLLNDEIPPKFEDALNDIDLIISTGCIGYIGCKSFEKIF